MAIDPTIYRRSYEAAAGPAIDPMAMRRQQVVEEAAAADRDYRAAQLQGEQAKIAADERKQALRGQIGGLAANNDGAGARRLALESGEFDIIDKLDSMDDSQRKRTLEVTRSIAPVIASLKQLPPAMRMQAASSVLVERGLTPEQIAGLDLSDAGIDAKIGEAMTITEYFAQQKDNRDFDYRAGKDNRDFNYRAGNDAAQRAASAANARISAGGAEGMGKAPSGYRYAPNGVLTYIKGGPADPDIKPLTEGQAKGTGLYRQAAAAARALNDISIKGGWDPSIVARALSEGGAVKQTALSPIDRRAYNAFRQLGNASLRLESGAVINDEEISRRALDTVPLPGDGPDVQHDKAIMRGELLAALRDAAGPGARNLPMVVGKPKAKTTPKATSGWGKMSVND